MVARFHLLRCAPIAPRREYLERKEKGPLESGPSAFPTLSALVAILILLAALLAIAVLIGAALLAASAALLVLLITIRSHATLLTITVLAGTVLIGPALLAVFIACLVLLAILVFVLVGHFTLLILRALRETHLH